MTLTWNTAALLFFLVYSAGYLSARWLYLRTDISQTPRSPESIDDEAILTEYRAGRRIDALRLYRTRYLCGLKEAQAGLQALVKAADRS
ncbi:hypothetical protein [Dyella caseinilytica]|uniref:Uncharacterized protein n=1 Tax=Dyella caseinilytica TaxID=1849581 RepID=A0ABX7GR22_9GAMM|nr:hypothetical protein [Dyella caseinilytica]QRN52443.1 hypothetical protein ISN74_13270 [Dyella caseinilytica]GGA06064.1 hypothetical protein GCM10011408_28760 [Dyella caseinilytica]